MVGVTFADLVSLIPVLAATYGVLMGAVALGIGWQSFSGRTSHGHRRSVQVSPQDATGQDPGGVR